MDIRVQHRPIINALATCIDGNNDDDDDDDDDDDKMKGLFAARWQYFHIPLMLAAFRFEPEFIKWTFTEEQDQEIKAMLARMCNRDKDKISKVLGELTSFEVELKIGNGNLEKDTAFSETAQKMSSWKWAMTYMAKWPTLKDLVMRLVALECSHQDVSNFGRSRDGFTQRKETGMCACTSFSNERNPRSASDRPLTKPGDCLSGFELAQLCILQEDGPKTSNLATAARIQNTAAYRLIRTVGFADGNRRIPVGVRVCVFF